MTAIIIVVGVILLICVISVISISNKLKNIAKK